MNLGMKDRVCQRGALLVLSRGQITADRADLGNGLILYPVLAIGGTLCSLVAAVSFLRRVKRETFVATAVYAAAVLALLGLVLTFKAAPFIFSLRHIKNEDVALLQEAFNGFELWGGVRVLFQAAAFGANLLSLVGFARKCNSEE